MMDPWSLIYLNLALGVWGMAALVEAAAFFLCLSFRHLSKWTILMAFGFAGHGAASLVNRLLGRLINQSQSWRWMVSAVSGTVELVSILAIVFGLGLTLFRLQDRLAKALEPRHGRD